MNKTSIAIFVACLIVTGCVFFLLFKGIGLRSAPLIQPSVISKDFKNIPHSLVYRLFQEFQNSDYVVWGTNEDRQMNSFLITETKAEYKKLFKNDVSIIEMVTNFSLPDEKKISDCRKPCWILVPFKEANQLGENGFVQSFAKRFNNNYFTITLIRYDRNNVVDKKCESQKRLDLDCLIALSIREAQRRFKIENEKYFFLRKYNLSDYFLFVEN